MVPRRVGALVSVLAAMTALLAVGQGPRARRPIVFQCGAAVCAVDPDAGTPPRQLTADGRLAGVTRDGVTASWVAPGGALVQAPVAGGATRTVPFSGEVVNRRSRARAAHASRCSPAIPGAASGFPSADAAGTEVVAVLTAGETTGINGRIVRYSLATGAPIGDVTAGTTDTTPVFSVEADRVAFERDGQIVVKDLAGGAERVGATGTVSVRPSRRGRRALPRGAGTVTVELKPSTGDAVSHSLRLSR
jgi:hypothetical protein